MSRWHSFIRAFVAGAVLAVATTVHAAGEETAAKPDGTASKRWLNCDGMSGWFKSQCEGGRAAWYEGRPMLLLSGYAWHDPSTYDDEKLEAFNENAWGGGFGVGRNDDKGDLYTWYGLAFKDSHYDWTVMAGWSWMTYWPDKADFAVGLGYTAFIMTRPDIFNGIPFPAALPLASVKVGPAEVYGTFIPKLNGGVNHGNVAYFFGRIQF